jgi:DNA modification methylase
MVDPVIIGDCTLYCGDSAVILPTLERSDAVVTDPPYGIGMDGGNVGYKGFNNFEKLGWDKQTPSKELMALVIGASEYHIIWGGNYFELTPSRCFLIWDKGAGFKGRTYAECEMAWASFDANARIIEHDPLARGDYKGKFHPTQKPEAVMKWCIKHLPHGCATILDPFMGSGSTGVACAKMGLKFTGIEAQPQYFETACKRIEDAYRQPDMFVEPVAKPIQEGLPL